MWSDAGPLIVRWDTGAHALPITVRVVSDAEFENWIAAEKKNAGLDGPPATLTAAAH